MPDIKLELKIPWNLIHKVKVLALDEYSPERLEYIEIFRQYFESLGKKAFGNRKKESVELKIPEDLYQTMTEHAEKRGKTINALCIEMIEWFFLRD